MKERKARNLNFLVQYEKAQDNEMKIQTFSLISPFSPPFNVLGCFEL
jgi:hypothetical protein